MSHRVSTWIPAFLTVAAMAATAPAQTSLVPNEVELHPAVQQAINVAWLTDEERAELRIFHGLWRPDDLATVESRAIVALNGRRFDDQVWDEPDVHEYLRAEMLLQSGVAEAAIALLEGAEQRFPDRRLRIRLLRAEALEMLGRFDEARRVTDQSARYMLRQMIDDPAELVAGVRALFLRSRLQGQPTRDFQTMLDLLGRARNELDRLYWPAHLAEAVLLMDKSKDREAIAALHETLRLNPRCAEAWYLLGTLAIDRFDFGSAGVASAHLHRLNPSHPLADLLDAESFLIQNDPQASLRILQRLLDDAPKMRRAHELLAATYARLYDEDAMDAALRRYDELSPGSPRALYVAGRHLSYDRQYDDAARLLREAIERQPYWPTPQIELGLLLLQSGEDEEALAVLHRVAEFDRFNVRAANSLHLLEELATFDTIETDNFIIRYKPGIDEVLVAMMPERLEEIHRIVTGRFRHEPDRKTIIEVMPDHQWFAVRVTGMPFVHTIAACTGPVIAMEVPREGSPRRHLGTFDWPRVIQHEYAHTITLSQTRNRIPHWLTEAAAVSMELRPRGYDTEQLLARAYHTGTLFNFEEINWAFVRPRRPTDRAQAYAQGHWMVEYMDERYGKQALIELMQQYYDGQPEREAMMSVFGISREQFFEGFHQWAGEQVEQWGFSARPRISELVDELRRDDPELMERTRRSMKARLDVVLREVVDRIGRPVDGEPPGGPPITVDDWPPVAKPDVRITDEHIERWLIEYPDHPDIVELWIRRRIAEGREDDPPGGDRFVDMLNHYATLRPGDMLPHRRLADRYLTSDDPLGGALRAIPHLEELDLREERTYVFAAELAVLYRRAGDLDRAMEKATRALHINPYHAGNRELAAAIATQHGSLETARMHIHALTILEPDRPQHQRRLEAIDLLIGQSDIDASGVE